MSEVVGDGKVECLTLRDLQTGQERKLAVTGVFIAIGHAPNTDILRDNVALDPEGYVVTAAGYHGHQCCWGVRGW